MDEREPRSVRALGQWRHQSGIGFFALLFLIAACAKDAATSGSADFDNAVRLRCLTVNKKVIPLYRQSGQLWTSDIKLPELVLCNFGPEPITPVEVRITGACEGEEVTSYTIPEPLLRDILQQTNSSLGAKLGKDKLRNVLSPRMATQFGEMQFWDTRLSDGAVIGESESAVILLPLALHFSYTGLSRIDDLKIAVTVRGGERTRTVECPVELTPYEVKGRYTFPLQGELCITNLPTSLGMHRRCMSQEFAVDILASAPLENGHLRTTRTDKPQGLTDYLIFGKPVKAVGEGVVVEVASDYPDSVQGNPAALSGKEVDALVDKMEARVGFIGAVVGNYVIIDHENGEFSLYGHLAEKSIGVKVGDRVRAGDVVGAVGNTGHSTEPHLHFQLMDSKDFLTANSLPFTFVDLPLTSMDQLCRKANGLFASDYVMVRVGGTFADDR